MVFLAQSDYCLGCLYDELSKESRDLNILTANIGIIDDWGDYERLLGKEYKHCLGKDQAQRFEKMNSIHNLSSG